MSVLKTSPDLKQIIKKAVERIGEDHAKSRDHKYDYHGMTLKNEDLVIEEALKEAANEMAEKMVLENTIDGMVKSTIKEIGGGSGFEIPQGGSDSLKKFNKRQEMGEQLEGEDYKNIDLTSAPNKRYADFKSSESWGKLSKYLDTATVWADIDGNTKEDAENIGWNEELWNGPGLKQNIQELESEPIYGLWLAGFLYGNIAFDDNTQLAQAEPTLDESTTNTIKKLVSKKLKKQIRIKENTQGKFTNSPVKSGAVPGLDAYEKAIKKSKTDTDGYLKDTKKKFEDYADIENNSKPEFPHQNNSKTADADGQFQYYRNDDEQEEYIDDNRGMGLQDADGVMDLEKLSDYLDGSSTTGNAQVDSDGNALGNVTKSDLGKKIEKTTKRKKKKTDDALNSMSNDKRYVPNIQKVKTVKEDVAIDMKNMKKLWTYNKKTQ